MATLLARAFHTLRVWLDLADPSESRLTPDHGWLLPAPSDFRAQRRAAGERRAARRAATSGAKA